MNTKGEEKMVEEPYVVRGKNWDGENENIKKKKTTGIEKHWNQAQGLLMDRIKQSNHPVNQCGIRFQILFNIMLIEQWMKRPKL